MRYPNYRSMCQEQIFKLDAEGCIRGIKSCTTELSIARKYNNAPRVQDMELQIGAFKIQLDMIEAGDIKPQ